MMEGISVNYDVARDDVVYTWMLRRQRVTLRSVKAGPKCLMRDMEVCESIAIIRKCIAIVCRD